MRPSLFPQLRLGNRVEVPRLFIAELRLDTDSWLVRLRCPVTGDIERIEIAGLAASDMVPSPDVVFQRWAAELTQTFNNNRDRGLTTNEVLAAIRTSRRDLLNRRLAEAEQNGRRGIAAQGGRVPPRTTPQQDRRMLDQIRDYAMRELEQVAMANMAAFSRLTSDRNSRAEEKSRKLLKENLTKEQNEEFDHKGYFTVRVKGTGRELRIYQEPSFNVVDPNVGTKYCGRFIGVPIWDQMLAQKLYLENFPDDFFAVANDNSRMVFGGGPIPVREGPQDPPEPPRNLEEYRAWRRNYAPLCGCSMCRFIRLNPETPGAVTPVQDLRPVLPRLNWFDTSV